MKTTLSLYASKKLLPFLGKEFQKNSPKVVLEEINPLYQWYGDIYYYERKKYLIFCNELTRVSFMIGPYQVDQKVHFMKIFTNHLEKKLKAFLPDSDQYFKKMEDIGWITKPRKGASAFLNHLKVDLDYCEDYYKARNITMKLPEDFDRMYTMQITSKTGIKDYFYPEKYFQEEWVKVKL